MIKLHSLLAALFILASLLVGCATTRPEISQIKPASEPLSRIAQIDSYNPQVASEQALAVVNNNGYEQDFFSLVFARLVDQCRDSKATDNAAIIWDNFVVPLKSSGKVPPDLITTTWNNYFSRQFASLPTVESAPYYCQRLPNIKVDLEREYDLKKVGFEITEQGSADTHFLNAMYVYNTMWAACKQ